MEENGKEYIKLKVASSLRIILKEKKELQNKNKADDVEDIRLVASLRKLEAESGLSYNIIQGVFSGNRESAFYNLNFNIGKSSYSLC